MPNKQTSEIDAVARTLSGVGRFDFDKLPEDGDHPETNYLTKFVYRETAKAAIKALDSYRVRRLNKFEWENGL